MFGGFGNRAAAYAKVGVETGVNTADPHKLILMLFDGALLQVRTAGIAMEKRDIPGKGQAVSKAIEIIRRVRDSGVSVLMIEHIMQAVMELSDRVVVINSGSVLKEGAPREVVSDPRVIEAYLGKEYSHA